MKITAQQRHEAISGATGEITKILDQLDSVRTSTDLLWLTNLRRDLKRHISRRYDLR